jgi:hypothetical protein
MPAVNPIGERTAGPSEPRDHPQRQGLQERHGCADDEVKNAIHA